MTTRTVETANPATPSASFPLVPLLKPASGNLTLTATVYRDSGDDSATAIKLKDPSGSTIASTTITTPAGNQEVSLSIDTSSSDSCELPLTITVEPGFPPVSSPCCPIGDIPGQLTVTVTGATGGCSQILGKTTTINFGTPTNGNWAGILADFCGADRVVTLGCAVNVFGPGQSAFALNVSESVAWYGPGNFGGVGVIGQNYYQLFDCTSGFEATFELLIQLEQIGCSNCPESSMVTFTVNG